MAACDATAPDARPVAAVRVSPDSISLRVNRTLQMSALVLAADGDTLRDRPVTWSSSDTARIQVSASGLAATRSHGTATVIASTEGVSGSALLRVLEPVRFISITPFGATIVPGGGIDLDAVLTGVAGTRLSDRDVEWTSSDPAVAVSALGVATAPAGAAGSATITATSEGVTSPAVTVEIHAPTFVSLAAGQSAWHSCGIAAGGRAFCWGENIEGGLGNGTVTDSGLARSGLTAPVGVLGSSFSSIGLGAGFTCGVEGAAGPGLVLCWGAGDEYKLGNASLANRAVPAPVTGGRLAAQVIAGIEHGCLLTVDSLAYCWGDGVMVPTAVPGAMRFAALFGGYHKSCGLAADSLAYCWSVSHGPSGPAPVPGGLRFAEITLGFFHACGVAADGVTYCWGVNNYGQLGDGTNTTSDTPVAVSGPAFARVAAGAEFTCGVTAAGAAYCWGLNSFGQLGNPAGASSNVPVPVSGGLTFARVAAGSRHACGLTSANVAYCWGWNAVGQLGDGTRVDRPAPVRVTGQP